jgi:hypothetical protein
MEPVMTKSFGKLSGVWDRVWRIYGESTEGYSGQTRCKVNGEARWLMLSLRGMTLGSARLMQLLEWGVRLGSRMTYAAPGVLLSKSQYDSRTQTEGPSS